MDNEKVKFEIETETVLTTDSRLNVQPIVEDSNRSTLKLKLNDRILESNKDFLTPEDLVHKNKFKNTSYITSVYVFYTSNKAIIESKDAILKAYGSDENHTGVLGILPMFYGTNDEVLGINVIKENADEALIIFELPTITIDSLKILSDKEKSDLYEHFKQECKSVRFLKDVYFAEAIESNDAIKAYFDSEDIVSKIQSAVTFENPDSSINLCYGRVYDPSSMSLMFLGLNVCITLKINDLKESFQTNKKFFEEFTTLGNLDKALVSNIDFSNNVLGEIDTKKSRLKSIDKTKMSIILTKTKKLNIARFLGVGQKNLTDTILAYAENNNATKFYLQTWITDYLNSIILYNNWFKELSGTMSQLNKLRDSLVDSDKDNGIVDITDVAIRQKAIYYNKINSFLYSNEFIQDAITKLNNILTSQSKITSDSFKSRELSVYMSPIQWSMPAFMNSVNFVINDLHVNVGTLDSLLDITNYISSYSVFSENDGNKSFTFGFNDDDTIAFLASKFDLNPNLAATLKACDIYAYINAQLELLQAQDGNYNLSILKLGFLPLTITLDGKTIFLPAMYNPLTSHVIFDSTFTSLINRCLTAGGNGLLSGIASGTGINLENFKPLVSEYSDMLKNDGAMRMLNKIVELDEVKFVSFIFRQSMQAIKNFDKRFLDFLNQRSNLLEYAKKCNVDMNKGNMGDTYMRLYNDNDPATKSVITIDLNPAKYRAYVNGSTFDANDPFCKSIGRAKYLKNVAPINSAFLDTNATLDAVGSKFSEKDPNRSKGVSGAEVIVDHALVSDSSSNKFEEPKLEITKDTTLVTDDESESFSNNILNSIRSEILRSSITNMLDFRDFYFNEYVPLIKKNKIIAERNLLIRKLGELEKKLLVLDTEKRDILKTDIDHTVNANRTILEAKYKEIGNKLAALQHIKHIEKIEIDESIKTLTLVLDDHIYVKDKRSGWEYDLGKLKISVPFSLKKEHVFRSASPESIRWFAAKYSTGDVVKHRIRDVGDIDYGPYAVVHGRADGGVCLGDSVGPFRDAFKSNNLPMFAILAVQYAQSMNEKDVWGRRCNQWRVLKPVNMTDWFDKFVIGRNYISDFVKNDGCVDKMSSQLLLTANMVVNALDDSEFVKMSDEDIFKVIEHVNENDPLGIFKFKYIPEITSKTWQAMLRTAVDNISNKFAKIYSAELAVHENKAFKLSGLEKLGIIKTSSGGYDYRKLNKGKDAYSPLYGIYHSIHRLKCLPELQKRFNICFFKSNCANGFAKSFQPQILTYTNHTKSNVYVCGTDCITYDGTNISREENKVLDCYRYDQVAMPMVSCFDVFNDGSNFFVTIVSDNNDYKLIMGFIDKESARKAGVNIADENALDKFIDENADRIIEQIPYFVKI